MNIQSTGIIKKIYNEKIVIPLTVRKRLGILTRKTWLSTQIVTIDDAQLLCLTKENYFVKSRYVKKTDKESRINPTRTVIRGLGWYPGDSIEIFTSDCGRVLYKKLEPFLDFHIQVFSVLSNLTDFLVYVRVSPKKILKVEKNKYDYIETKRENEILEEMKSLNGTIKRTLELKDGTKYNIYFKKRGYTDIDMQHIQFCLQLFTRY